MPQTMPPLLENLADCPRCGDNNWRRFTYHNPKLGSGYWCLSCGAQWKEWSKLRFELIMKGERK